MEKLKWWMTVATPSFVLPASSHSSGNLVVGKVQLLSWLNVAAEVKSRPLEMPISSFLEAITPRQAAVVHVDNYLRFVFCLLMDHAVPASQFCISN